MSIGPVWFAVVVSIWTALALPALVSGLVGRDYFGLVAASPRERTPGPVGMVSDGTADPGHPADNLPDRTRTGGRPPATARWWAVGDLLVGAWAAHYDHCTLLWPWLAQWKGSSMPAVTCAAGFVFNIVNGLLFGWILTSV